MEKTKAQKKNKKIGSSAKEIIAIVLVAAIIAGYVFYEVYSATNVPLETYTANIVTAYKSIDATALAVRDEKTIEAPSGSVTVACAADGEKVAKDGKVAMKFPTQDDAQSYSQKLALEAELEYYLNLESKSNEGSTDIEAIDSQIIGDVNDYVRALASDDYSGAETAADNMNDSFTRRQIVIGTDIDFSTVKSEIQSQLDKIDSSCEPTGYVTTSQSGIFSGYTDGCEASFDYENIEDITPSKLDEYMETAKSAKATNNALGKLITSYSWYFCCKVSTEDIRDIDNGDKVEVAIQNSDRVINCTVVSGAETNIGEKETVLVLQCADMDSEIASYRTEDIEIRYQSYTGIKVPAGAIRVNEGQKGVYVLISSQVKFRQVKELYTTDDYVIVEYDAKNEDGIRLYDEIITEGKDLYNGKVYT